MDGELTLLATGDIHISEGGTPDLLSDVAPVLRSGDVTIVNWEGPSSDRGAPAFEKSVYGSPTLRMPPSAVDDLVAGGVDAAGLANNHAMDYGADALLDTMRRLEAAGIAHAGGGRDLAEAFAPAVLDAGDVRVGFLSITFVYGPVGFPARDASPGVACVAAETSYAVPGNLSQAPGVWPRSRTAVKEPDRSRVLDTVRALAGRVDVVVVGCHWGLSALATSKAMGIPSHAAPNIVMDYQEEMGRALVDAGAQLVVGHHPHRLQGVERYRDGLICYSLGNLAFGFRMEHFKDNSAILKVRVGRAHRRLAGASFVPVRVGADPYKPHVAQGAEAEGVLAELHAESAAYGTDLALVDGEVALAPFDHAAG